MFTLHNRYRYTKLLLEKLVKSSPRIFGEIRIHEWGIMEASLKVLIENWKGRVPISLYLIVYFAKKWLDFQEFYMLKYL